MCLQEVLVLARRADQQSFKLFVRRACADHIVSPSR
jgi:hypothetical protein